jgi:Mlc titration factor MtfA (ptsG expression regulator)
MALQNPKDWEFLLSEDPIQLSQPSTSRRRLRDKDGPSERYVQPRVEVDLQQLPLTSLRALQLDARTFVIVLEAETILDKGHQVVFEGYFENINVGNMVTRLSDDVGHHL